MQNNVPCNVQVMLIISSVILLLTIYEARNCSPFCAVCAKEVYKLFKNKFPVRHCRGVLCIQVDL